MYATKTAAFDAAVQYASKGWAVFPCSANKSPRTINGFKAATINHDTIWDWWRLQPDALIGLAVPAGIVIVDIDPRNGGGVALRKLQAEVGEQLPSTLKARTGGGGLHLWYSLDLGKQLRPTLCDGVDLKQNGKGYVIVPPSVSIFGAYEWTTDEGCDAAILPAPAWLLAVAAKPAVPARIAPAAKMTQRAPWEPATAYGSAALTRACGRLSTAKIGARNNSLFREACGLYELVAGGELDGDLATHELVGIARALGLPDHETLAALRAAALRGEANPKTAPRRTS